MNVVDLEIILVNILIRPKLAGIIDARLDQKVMHS